MTGRKIPNLDSASILACGLNVSVDEIALSFGFDVPDQNNRHLTPAELASNYSLEELVDAMSIAAKKTTTNRTKVAA